MRKNHKTTMSIPIDYFNLAHIVLTSEVNTKNIVREFYRKSTNSNDCIFIFNNIAYILTLAEFKNMVNVGTIEDVQLFNDITEVLSKSHIPVIFIGPDDRIKLNIIYFMIEESDDYF